MARIPGRRMHFLDIGFGKAERIARYARLPRSKNRFFVGIDTVKQHTIIPSRQKNVKLLLGNTEARLKRFKAESFSVINMDFFPLTKIEVVGGTVRGMIFESTEAFPGLMHETKRVLRKNGRLYLTVPLGAVSEAKSILETNGFSEIKQDEVPEKNKNITEAMQKHFEIADTDPTARPYRIVAVKRH